MELEALKKMTENGSTITLGYPLTRKADRISLAGFLGGSLHIFYGDCSSGLS